MESCIIILKYIENILILKNKSLLDILYISFYDSTYKDNFSCTIIELINIIKNNDEAYEYHLAYVYDLKFVGKNWWINYTGNMWKYYEMPTKPVKNKEKLQLKDIFFKIK